MTAIQPKTFPTLISDRAADRTFVVGPGRLLRTVAADPEEVDPRDEQDHLPDDEEANARKRGKLLRFFYSNIP